VWVAPLEKLCYANSVIKKCIDASSSSFEHAASLESEGLALACDLLWEAGVSPVVMLASDRFGATVGECLLDNLTGPLLHRLKWLLHNGEASFRGERSATHAPRPS